MAMNEEFHAEPPTSLEADPPGQCLPVPYRRWSREPIAALELEHQATYGSAVKRRWCRRPA